MRSLVLLALFATPLCGILADGVKVSERFGYDPHDATIFLQAALDSDEPVIVIDRQACDWLVRPLRVVSRRHKKIVFEKGAFVRAVRGGFRGVLDVLLTFENCQDIELTGAGSDVCGLRMWREDYRDLKVYKRSEWRHALAFHSCEDVKLSGFSANESGGDGLYVGVSDRTEQTPCRRFVVRDCLFDRNLRQGISVISVDGLLLDGVRMTNTAGGAPEAGIDIEPNSPKEVVRNVILRNCVSENNAGRGFEIELAQFNASTEPVSILFENCRSTGNRDGTSCARSSEISRCELGAGYPRGSVRYRDCRFEKSARSGIRIHGKPRDSVSVTFENCVLDSNCRDRSYARLGEIRISHFGNYNPPTDGVDFGNLRIEGGEGHEWLTASPLEFATDRLSSLKGVVTLCGSNGTDRIVKLDETWARNLQNITVVEPLLKTISFDTAGAVPCDGNPGEMERFSTPRFRDQVEYVFWCDRAGTCRFISDMQRLGKNQSAFSRSSVEVVELSGGRVVTRVPMPGVGETEFSLTVPREGFYSMRFRMGGRFAHRLTGATVPVGVLVRGMQEVRDEGGLYVSTYQDDAFDLQIAGEGNERVGLVVTAPSENVVWRGDSVGGRDACRIRKAESGFYRLEFARPRKGIFDDYVLSLGGVSPVFFCSPKKTWRTKEGCRLKVSPQWISGRIGKRSECPAPVLRKAFRLEDIPAHARFDLAVAGWCEVRVNGKKVGEEVLSPVTCQPDRRISSLAFDLSGLLVAGPNELEILLGNGWFNMCTRTAWGFDEAPWRRNPMVSGELHADGKAVLRTDASWTAYDSPIDFDSLRNGERYDARREGVRANERSATVEKYAPCVRVSPEDSVPCREGETFAVQKVIDCPMGGRIYDFGANISGWCEIDVRGEPGACVAIDYDESLTPTNTLLGSVTGYARKRGETRPLQHDEYVLRGAAAGESWHPVFVYHGFRYAHVRVTGNADVKDIRARFIHSDFAQAGRLETSDKTFAALQAATCRSYLSNFIGIPTDCPHREKNGWTGDAQLAMETGLWNYDAKAGYEHYLRMLLDSQQPNGAIPCIVPHTPKFGLGWGSGPAWDAALFEIPWQLFRFYGDDSSAREAYPAMKRYLTFILSKRGSDGLVEYGLGDWCDSDESNPSSVKLTDSAYVYQFCRRLAFWARHFGETAVALEFEGHATLIRDAFNRAFYKGDGLYAFGRWTELAAPLYFGGLCASNEEGKVASRLVAAVRDNGYKASFGILGAKWVPRVLAERGYADDAWRLFVQPSEPGWANWLRTGDGTLQEDWDGRRSHNHIMFGDLSAWAYEYLAGIVPSAPGFAKVTIRPHFPNGLQSVCATHETPCGRIAVSWKRVGSKLSVAYSAPQEVEVTVDCPVDVKIEREKGDQ